MDFFWEMLSLQETLFLLILAGILAAAVLRVSLKKLPRGPDLETPGDPAAPERGETAV